MLASLFWAINDLQRDSRLRVQHAHLDIGCVQGTQNQAGHSVWLISVADVLWLDTLIWWSIELETLDPCWLDWFSQVLECCWNYFQKEKGTWKRMRKISPVGALKSSQRRENKSLTCFRCVGPPKNEVHFIVGGGWGIKRVNSCFEQIQVLIPPGWRFWWQWRKKEEEHHKGRETGKKKSKTSSRKGSRTSVQAQFGKNFSTVPKGSRIKCLFACFFIRAEKVPGLVRTSIKCSCFRASRLVCSLREWSKRFTIMTWIFHCRTESLDICRSQISHQVTQNCFINWLKEMPLSVRCVVASSLYFCGQAKYCVQSEGVSCFTDKSDMLRCCLWVANRKSAAWANCFTLASQWDAK